jgi:rhodanese-related sulfurtransferase
MWQMRTLQMIENVTPAQTWQAIQSDPLACVVDVRTEVEWNFVGVPDLSSLAKAPSFIPWQIFPSMQVNEGFVEQMKKAGLTPDHKIYFLCRSGVRSLAAAQAAYGNGFVNVFNIEGGFEGPLDANQHRGTTAGWKLAGLPWMQR